jgi:hypothetical protein
MYDISLVICANHQLNLLLLEDFEVDVAILDHGIRSWGWMMNLCYCVGTWKPCMWILFYFELC